MMKPHSTDEEQQHIAQVMQDDDALAVMLAKHQRLTADQIAEAVNDIAVERLVGSDGKIDPNKLLKSPTIKQIKEDRARLSHSVSVDDVELDKRDKIVNTIQSINNRSAIAAVVFSLLSNSTNQMNAVMGDALDADLQDEAKWQQGNVPLSNHDAKQIIQTVQQSMDPQSDSEFNDSVWKSNDMAYAAMAAAIWTKIRQRPQPDEFYKFLKSNDIVAPSVGHTHTPKTYDPSIKGFLQRNLGELMRTYRTQSAKGHSALKYAAYSKAGVKKVVLINEFGACERCKQFLGRPMQLEDAKDLVPIHANCRCEIAPLDLTDSEH